MKKLYTIIISVLLLCSISAIAQTATAPSSGSGTTASPYQIANLENLYWIAADASRWDKHYEQTANIDASTTSGWSGGGWTPIGNATTRFTGSYDGKGYKITGLTIDRPSAANQGLFGHVGHNTASTTIKNVHLETTTITGARGSGTLIGRITGNANTHIEYCSSNGGTVTGDGATGGLIGSHNSYQTTPGGQDRPILRYSWANVNVVASGSGGKDKYGGLVGCAQKGTVTNCYARGSVTVAGGISGQRVGGIAGCCDIRGLIEYSYSTGSVSATGSTLVGGLVGNLGGTGGNEGVVQFAYWDNQTSGQASSAGGTGTTTANMKLLTTFVGWDTTDVWKIQSGTNDEYPYLIVNNITSSDYTWTGTTSTLWNVATNWNPERIPPSGASIIIANTTNKPVIAEYTTIGNLTINASAELTIADSAALTVEGNITNNGTLTLKSSSAEGTATILTNGTVGAGTYKVEQYITGGRNWYISSPVSAAQSVVFDAANANNLMYYYDEAGTDVSSWWVEIAVNNAALTPKLGYIVNVENPGVYTFTGGALNNFEMKLEDLTVSTLNPKQGFHLIGNPYPSYLNPGASAFESNVATTIWYRTNNGTNYEFLTYNYTAGTGSTGVNAHIPPNQSFWIRVSDPSNTIVFNNDMRRHRSDGDFNLKNMIPNNLMRLFLTNTNGNTDEQIILFNDMAGTGFDNWDSEKQMSGNIPQLWSIESGKNLIINSLPEITNGLTIPLYMNILTAGNHSISFNLDDFTTYADAWLQDLQTGTMHDIRIGDYNFTSGVVNNNNRFVLVFDNVTTDVEGNTQTPVTIYGNENVVYVNTPENGIIQVWDITGRLVATMDATQGMNTLQLPVSTGIFVVRVAAGSQIKTAKVVLW